MTELKPYLIRSIYEWVVDNNLTPYLQVDARHPAAVLPMQFVEDNKIVLNLRPLAVEALCLGNEFIEFNTRFSGKSTYVNAPVAAVMAIYAKENGRGMVFDIDNFDNEPPPPPIEPPKKEKPKLRVLK